MRIVTDMLTGSDHSQYTYQMANHEDQIWSDFVNLVLMMMASLCQCSRIHWTQRWRKILYWWFMYGSFYVGFVDHSLCKTYNMYSIGHSCVNGHSHYYKKNILLIFFCGLCNVNCVILRWTVILLPVLSSKSTSVQLHGYLSTKSRGTAFSCYRNPVVVNM